jgi:hypothetical protein
MWIFVFIPSIILFPLGILLFFPIWSIYIIVISWQDFIIWGTKTRHENDGMDWFAQISTTILLLCVFYLTAIFPIMEFIIRLKK